jgi:alpha-glucosidase
VLGNHDRGRVASRLGPAQARVAAMLLLTLRGTPTMYYGDELGMTDVTIASEHALDPYERRVPGRGVGRDPERTPMQWTAGAHAGFCPPDAQPWLPVAEDHHRINVAAEQHDPRSVLALYRRLLALRRGNHALTGGAYRTVRAAEGVLAYLRESDGERAIVALNLTAEPRTVALSGRVRLSTRMDREREQTSGELRLRADEGVVLEPDERP